MSQSSPPRYSRVDVVGAATSTPEAADNPRKRQRTACDRCKSRKQRCDNAYPQCSNCAKAGLDCNKPPPDLDDRYGLNSQYTRALEDQIAYLETRLQAIERQNQQSTRPEAFEPPSVPTCDQDRRYSVLESPIGSEAQYQHNVADVVGLLSLGKSEAPSYIGSSSGYALATDLGRMVQATVWNKALWVPAAPGEKSDVSGERTGTGVRTRRITLQELQADRAEPPSDALGSRLIEAYIVRIHPRFPFLVRSDIWEAHRCRYTLGSRNHNGDSTERPRDAAHTHEEGFALFVLYMVYAIGALNLRLTEDYQDTAPEKFYVSALQHISSAREASSIYNLKAMALLILYHLRSESHNGLWHLAGLAIRTVTDVGLHREASTKDLHPFEAQLRRRLFWSVYALEGVLSSALGRPISLSDCDIDQPLPLSIDDSDPLDGVMSGEITRPPAGREAFPHTNMSQFILLSQLRLFETRIQRTIYRVDRPTHTLQHKLPRLVSDLEAWRQGIPPTLQSTELDRLMLNYHKCARLLLQPFLSTLDPSSALFAQCAAAAGSICQIHKRLHQNPEYGHSFIAVQTVFVAGITLLYALWRGRDKVWSFGVSNDIRAATCVLAIMGERAPWIRRYRDTFENMVEATMAALQGPSGGGEQAVGQSEQLQTDFSMFEGLEVTDHAALDMARELTEWFS